MASVNAKLLECLDADLIVTTAGVSKGDYDLVKDALAQHGQMDFWSVRMRPAKPLAFGLLEAPNGTRVPLLGLPGNPVSSMVAFEQFGRPAVHKMMGRTASSRPVVQAILDEPIHNTDGRRVFARAIITKRDGAYHARLTGNQGSNLLTSIAQANGLAICPEEVPKMEAGQTVDVQMIDWPEDVF
jgi:molybdopterin molybdotransferase